ncbi:MAG: AAA family ATPase [Chloroflexi bacterium]|nr:AAA family ATPase [Chloroflexota bacterium]
MVDPAINAVIGNPLLATKIYTPRMHTGRVSRPRLIERLAQGIERKLTLISAPAGFGKTTLLAEWLAVTSDGQRSAGWVSLDQSDNEPTLFWAYFITALQKVHSEVGESALSLLRSPQPPPIESILTRLINEISAIEEDSSTGSGRGIVLVLDDYHVIDAQPIHSAIAFFIDHLPPQMHLVIASRADPPLPLSRLRARGELTELRATDLNFTPDEAASFLNEVMSLDLSAADVAALEARTEGWIAALQLAALSMRGREDATEFISAFAGDDRYIVDYLVEEVLQRQPESIRSFLLQTSILERLCGPLCDAVTGQENGKAMLEALERGNLFVVPLDDKRHWYRYHHLFSDVVHAFSMEEQPDQIPALHRRASEWYQQNGLLPDAVRHALTAEDFERAAVLVEMAWPAILKGFQTSTWLGWVEALPHDLVTARPVLSVGHAWTLLDAGELEAADARLHDAELQLGITAESSDRPRAISAESVVVSEEEFQSLSASIANARAYHAQAVGDASVAIEHARHALDLLPEGDHYWRGTAMLFMSRSHWTKGELVEAQSLSASAIASFEAAGNSYFQIVSTVLAGDVARTQGRFGAAMTAYERSLHLATGGVDPIQLGTTDTFVGLSEIQRERGDLDMATRQLQRASELGEQAVLPGGESRSCVAMARIRMSQGDLNSALDLLDKAERLYKRDTVPNVHPVAALKARIWLAQDRLDKAWGWANEQGLSVVDDLSYLREFEHITLVRVLMARYLEDQTDSSIGQVMSLLERLLKAADEAGRTGSVIEILVLQSLAYKAQGNLPNALVQLERALRLAEPEGFVRIFVDEGEAMRILLRHAAADGIAMAYAGRLLAAFGVDEQPADATSKRSGASMLAEHLTERESEILRLISVGMTNQEIAGQLVISVATVKRHITNIYGKLGVSHRTQATARANELRLL